MTRLRQNEKKNNLSGLMLPIIIAFIVVILIVRAFFGGSNSANSNHTNEGFVNISPNQEKSEIYIYMSGDSKKQIDGITKMYPTDAKMEVVNGEAKITLDGGNSSKIFANKLGEMKYEGKNSGGETFTISNGDMWVETDEKPITFNLRNFSVTSSATSVYSFSQNLMAASVYVLKGEISLKPNIDKSDAPITTIGVGQKVTLLNSDISGDNLKVDDKIEPIDDIFRESDFYNKHNGSSYLNVSQSSTGSESSTGTTGTGSQLKGQKSMIITYPDDETTVDTNVINIEGKITSNNVEKITLNDKEASLNKEEKTFIAKDFQLEENINNIVYKAYDKDNNMLTKGVLTVYTSAKDKAKEGVDKPTVTTYPLSSKDFRLITPAENPFKTTESIVKIGGVVNKGAVKFITINDFRLTKFPQFSSNWYYFANKDYGTMNDGINLYTIKYYGKDDELLYTSLFTIVKEPTSTTGDNSTTETGSGSSNG